MNAGVSIEDVELLALEENVTGLRVAVAVLSGDTSTIWLLACGVMAMLMQVAHMFSLAGTLSGPVVLTGAFQKVALVALALPLWWAFAYAFAFGSGSGFLGASEGLFAPRHLNHSAVAHSFATFNFIFIGISHICSAAAGRARVEVIGIIAVVLCAFPLPVALHWASSRDGWLSLHSNGLAVVEHGILTTSVFSGVGVLVTNRFLPPLVLASNSKFNIGAGFFLEWVAFYAVMCFGVGAVRPAQAASIAVSFTLGQTTSVMSSLLLTHEFQGFLDLDYVTNAATASLIAMGTACPTMSIGFAPVAGVTTVALYEVLRSQRHFSNLCEWDRQACMRIVSAVWGAFLGVICADTERMQLTFGAQPNWATLLGSTCVAACAVAAWAGLWSGAVASAVYLAGGFVQDGNLCCDKAQHGSGHCEFESIMDKKRTYSKGSVSYAPSHRETFPDFDFDDADESTCQFTITNPHGEDSFCRERTTANQEDVDVDEPPAQCTPPRKWSWQSVFRLAVYILLVGGASAVSQGSDLEVNDASEALNETMSAISTQIAGVEASLAQLSADLDVVWALTCGILVFMMQLGFCFLESGSVRSGNVINIIFKNVTDCSLGAVAWWCVGYSFAFSPGNGFIGWSTDYMFFSPSPNEQLSGSLGHFFLSYTYMTTAATIVSGAVAERISLYAYAWFVSVISFVGYPVVAHWIWSGDGWLSPFSANRIAANGFLDFSGSVTIHLFGGTCAAVFASLLGPRKLQDGVDVFSDAGQLLVQPHNRFQLASGTLMLWVSWYCFNAGSVVSASSGGSYVAANACVTTCLSSTVATLTGMLVSRIWKGYFDVGDMCNCALVGLVSITAGCAYISPVYAVVVGVVSVPFYFGAAALRRKLRIDDVVDAAAVHGAGGVWGGISAGLFCDPARIRAATADGSLGADYGLFLGGGWQQLGVQCLGIVCVIAWCSALSVLMYCIIQCTIGARVSSDVELGGLDVHEHRAHSYDYISKLEKEQALEVVCSVTDKLVKFDLDGARRLLASDGKVDYVVALKDQLSHLTCNLSRYRPFLPDSLFNEEECEDADVDVPPPGQGGTAVMVFTDIQGSTATWEACPEAMKDALQVHNRVIRKCNREFGGYEVKTIGDSFMVAFDDREKAVLFALAVQQNLFEAGDEWPDELNDLPQTEYDEGWHGLRLRIGVNPGEVNHEVNPVTCRSDYTGSTVNKAARLEAASVGGAVCITKEFYDELCVSGFPQRVPICITEKAGVTLKGVPGVHSLVLIVPEELKARLPVLRGQAQPGRHRSVVSHRSNRMSQSGFRWLNSTSAPVLTFSRGSMCTVRLAIEEGALYATQFNGLLSFLIINFERSDGVIAALVGESIFANWNAQRKCTSYVDASLGFVRLCSGTQYEGTRLSIGIASGELRFGNVGTSSQKFPNIFSSGIEISQRLCRTSTRLKTRCVAAFLPNHPQVFADPAFYSTTRPIDTWEVTCHQYTHRASRASECISNSLRQPQSELSVEMVTNSMVVYELNSTLLWIKDSPLDDLSDYPGWSEAYRTAFHANDIDTITRLSSSTDDAVLVAVAASMSRDNISRVSVLAPPSS